MSNGPLPRFLRLPAALREFVTVAGTQAQLHIRPLHQYLAIRLVVEGGFDPQEITPCPPLKIEIRGGRKRLLFDLASEDEREQTLLGGLKTKAVDVVVAKPNVGPVIAISVKGTGNAFRNLTNRMEEAIGDSTNLHIMYPGLVYGFLHFLKANRAGEPGISLNDVAISQSGEVVNSIRRYHDVLLGLAGRRLVRNDYTRYEAVALALVIPHGDQRENLFIAFPLQDSPLQFARFFPTLYSAYDLRFPYLAPSLPNLRRSEWDIASPALEAIGPAAEWETILGYAPRVG